MLTVESLKPFFMQRAIYEPASAGELASALGNESALVVDGNLFVDGHVSVDDDMALLVDGNIECSSLWVAAGQLKCKTLILSKFMQFGCDDTQRMETLDVFTIKVPLLLAPYIQQEDLAIHVFCEFCEPTDVEVDDEIKMFHKLLMNHFEEIYRAL